MNDPGTGVDNHIKDDMKNKKASMKTEINLLPPNYLSPQKIGLIRLLSVFALITMFMLAAWGARFLNNYHGQMAKEVAALREENDALADEVQTLQGKQAEINIFKEEFKWQNRICEQRFSWHEYLQEMISVLQSKMVIDFINGNQDGQIIVDGNSLYLRDIAVATRKLDEIDFLAEARYDTVEYRSIPAADVNLSVGEDDYGPGNKIYGYTLYARLPETKTN